MNKVLLFFKWYIAFSKRLLRKPSFVAVILIIPLVTFAVSVIMSKESGLLTVALASDDNECIYYNKITDELCQETSAVRYLLFDSRESAIQSVSDGRASCAWLFPARIQEKMFNFASGDKSEVLCEVIVSRDSALLQLSREKLYGILYKNLSNELFVDFMTGQNLNIDGADSDYFREIIEDQQGKINSDLIEFSFIDAPERKLDTSAYLTSPIKGLLAIAMLICCLAAMMYSLEDENCGKYAMFSVSNRLFLHISCILSAAIPAGVVVYVSLIMSGNCNSLWNELINIFFYCFAITAFSLFCGVICKTPSVLCLILPVVIVLIIVFCPVFINIKHFGFIKNLLPTYHYLKAEAELSKVFSLLICSASYFTIGGIYYKLIYRY